MSGEEKASTIMNASIMNEMGREQEASTMNDNVMANEIDFENVKWDDVYIDDGELKEIQEIDVKKLFSKDLRKVCSRLKIRGVKNATKSVMIQRIIEYHGNKDNYKNVAKAMTGSKTIKEPQCAYYLRKHLELKPDLTGFVEADLPEDTFVESTDKVSKKDSPSSTSRKRKRENGAAELAEALRELNNSKMQTEIAKKKLDILERKEKRKEKEEERKEKEEKRKEKEEKRKEKEEKRNERSQLFEEWERIQANIRQLRKDMHDEPDESMKADIKSDIEGLMKRKKAVSIKLDIN